MKITHDHYLDVYERCNGITVLFRLFLTVLLTLYCYCFLVKKCLGKKIRVLYVDRVIQHVIIECINFQLEHEVDGVSTLPDLIY